MSSDGETFNRLERFRVPEVEEDIEEEIVSEEDDDILYPRVFSRRTVRFYRTVMPYAMYASIINLIILIVILYHNSL